MAAKKTANNAEKTKQQTKKASISGLLAKIEKLEKKLDLLNTLGKTMPVIILSSGAILGAIVYLSSVATIPDTTSTLPETGEEATLTEDFVILYPEYYTSVTLPDKVSGLSINGFYSDLTQVTFIAQKQGASAIEIGIGQKGSERGEYTTTWTSATEGRYFLWAEITHESGAEYKSDYIIIDIQ